MRKTEKKTITPEEVSKTKTESPLMTDEELEKVTGGHDAMESGTTEKPIKKSIGMGTEK